MQKKKQIIFLLLILFIGAAICCAGKKQVQKPLGAIIPLKIAYYAGEKQTQENSYRQEEYVDSYQQIDMEANNLKISNVKLVKEVDMETIYIEYPYFNNAFDETSRKINEQIYNQIIYHEVTGKNLTDNDGCRTEANITYHIIYIDENVISILFSGEITEGYGFTYFAKGLNFNLQSGEILSLADFYELTEIRDLVQKAVSRKLLTSENLLLPRVQKEEYLSDFLNEFDTDDYIKRTDNFFIKEDSIGFIADTPPSFREYIYLELKVEDINEKLAGINADFENDGEEDDMDSWLGEYDFVDAFPHNSGALNYIIGIDITIYKQDEDYYAQITGDGWFLQTRTLARVTGDKNSIDITFLENLPGDSLYENNIERYEYGEELLHFERLKNGEMRTEWKALRNQHPVFSETDDKISGTYFEKKSSNPADVEADT